MQVRLYTDPDGRPSAQLLLNGSVYEIECDPEWVSRVPEDGDVILNSAKEEVQDTAPRTLYVSRRLLNVEDVVAWAKDQGFKSILSDLHVTIVYSKTPVDWMKMGESMRPELTVDEGGARQIEQFGPNGAVVLAFACYDLSYRNERMMEAGCTSDFPEYQPHMTISYKGAPDDISGIEPYQGELVFGPERFAEITPEMMDPARKPDFKETPL
jgi:uncharacterized protein